MKLLSLSRMTVLVVAAGVWIVSWLPMLFLSQALGPAAYLAWVAFKAALPAIVLVLWCVSDWRRLPPGLPRRLRLVAVYAAALVPLVLFLVECAGISAAPEDAGAEGAMADVACFFSLSGLAVIEAVRLELARVLAWNREAAPKVDHAAGLGLVRALRRARGRETSDPGSTP